MTKKLIPVFSTTTKRVFTSEVIPQGVKVSGRRINTAENIFLNQANFAIVKSQTFLFKIIMVLREFLTSSTFSQPTHPLWTVIIISL